MMSWRLKILLSRMSRRAEPDAAFVRGLREHLASKGYLKPFAHAFPVWKPVLAALSVMLSLSLGTMSYAYASDDVLPDSPVYVVREAVESVELKLAPVFHQTKEKVETKLLARRLNELKLMQVRQKSFATAPAKRFLRIAESAAQNYESGFSGSDVRLVALAQEIEKRTQQIEGRTVIAAADVKPVLEATTMQEPPPVTNAFPSPNMRAGLKAAPSPVPAAAPTRPVSVKIPAPAPAPAKVAVPVPFAATAPSASLSVTRAAGEDAVGQAVATDTSAGSHATSTDKLPQIKPAPRINRWLRLWRSRLLQIKAEAGL